MLCKLGHHCIYVYNTQLEHTKKSIIFRVLKMVCYESVPGKRDETPDRQD